MSAWMDMANHIRTRLRSLVKLAGIEVVVDRQKSIGSMVSASVGKTRGACVTILWSRAGLENAEGGASEPVFLIRGYFLPVILDSNTTAVKADDVMEAMAAALTGWHPDGRSHSNDKLRPAGDIDLLPDKIYLIYEMAFTCRLPIPEPEFIESPTP